MRASSSSRSLSTSSPDVDSGWAFVVMLSGCLAYSISVGLSSYNPVIYAVLLDEFEQSPSTTAWTLTFNRFCMSMCGELATVLINLTGPRVTVAVGGVLCVVGLLACSFATNLTWILVFYGIVTGLGFSLVYFSHIVVIASYFKNYRTFAFAFCASGAGFGQFVFIPLTRVLTDEYHWRGAFLVLAGVAMNFWILAAASMTPRQRSASNSVEVKLIGQGSSDNEKKAQESSINDVCSQLRQQLHNLRLFGDPKWLCFCVGHFLISVCISGFFTHLVNFALVLGFTPLQGAFLGSASGIGSLCSRLVIAVVAQHPRVHVVGFYFSLFSLIGVVTAVMGFIGNYSGLLTCAVMFGIGNGAYALLPEATIHLIGVKRLSSGSSYCCWFCAMGLLLGGPVAAWIYEADPTYRSSFLIIGVLAVIGCAINTPSCITCRDGKIAKRGVFADDSS